MTQPGLFAQSCEAATPSARDSHPARVIEFAVPAVPVAQPRQKHAIKARCRRCGHFWVTGKAECCPRCRGERLTTTTTNYTPKTSAVVAFKATARATFQLGYRGAPMDGPVRLTVVFVFPRPARLRWKTRPMPRERHRSKPEIDNTVKALQDALNQLAFYDDAQVAELAASKWIASGDEQPHVRVRIEAL